MFRVLYFCNDIYLNLNLNKIYQLLLIFYLLLYQSIESFWKKF